MRYFHFFISLLLGAFLYASHVYNIYNIEQAFEFGLISPWNQHME